jgi:transposase
MSKLMAALSLTVHLSTEEIRQQLYSCTNGHHASYWQIVLTLSLNAGKTPQEYSAMLGCSLAKIYRIRSLYNQYGASFLQQLPWGGRREARCLMSREEEARLLQHHCDAALKGEVLVGRQLQQKIEQQLGHRVSAQYVLNLLHRHGWSKKAPRSFHPKQGEAEGQRQAFKKNA